MTKTFFFIIYLIFFFACGSDSNEITYANKEDCINQIDYKKRMAILKATNDYHSLGGNWNHTKHADYIKKIKDIEYFFEKEKEKNCTMQ